MGQVVGWSHVGESAAASRPHAFLWKSFIPNDFLGSMFDLGDLPGGNDQSVAHGINSRGQVVGEGSVASGPHAFLWSPNSPNDTTGTLTDLGDLAGSGGISSARDINGHGIVVGHSGRTGFERAFVWMPTDPNGTTGAMIDLNTLLDPISSAGWTLKTAEAINDFGQIVGNGLFDPDGPGGSPAVERAFMLTPIPEPATCVLLAVAALAWFCFNRIISNPTH
jgi:probable HAF family extracellular repeat protein